MTKKNPPFKTIIDDVLKYQGPLFLRCENMVDKDKEQLFRREERFCSVCGVETNHERVRNLWSYYWRCENCLDRQLREKGFFTPPYKKSSGRYAEQLNSVSRINDTLEV